MNDPTQRPHRLFTGPYRRDRARAPECNALSWALWVTVAVAAWWLL